MDFNDLYWHDAIIKKIEIDRQDPGKSDVILFEITWPDEIANKIVFEDVYWSRMTLNFGIVAGESIRRAYVAENDDIDLSDFYSKWKGMMNNQKLNCYIINTNSTGSEIKIIARNFKIKS